jgi:hypothetical protein
MSAAVLGSNSITPAPSAACAKPPEFVKSTARETRHSQRTLIIAMFPAPLGIDFAVLMCIILEITTFVEEVRRTVMRS